MNLHSYLLVPKVLFFEFSRKGLCKEFELERSGDLIEILRDPYFLGVSEKSYIECEIHLNRFYLLSNPITPVDIPRIGFFSIGIDLTRKIKSPPA